MAQVVDGQAGVPQASETERAQLPALIPLPRQLRWTTDTFPLHACNKILVKDTSLLPEARGLQQTLQAMGRDLRIEENAKAGETCIELAIANVQAPLNQHEAYQLSVTANKVRLTANTPHGIFNGIQTLRQLITGPARITGCEISDHPAFGWRGYLIDVGRNYMPMDLLKELVRIMAANKLNVFHFHATEDIAWRFAIKQYPQLTAPENMLRNKGHYYSEA